MTLVSALPPRLFVTGIGTDVGKTLACAALARAHGYHYWKPVQAGLPADADTVAQLAELPNERIVPGAHTLALAASPHQAAAEQGLHLAAASIAARLPALCGGTVPPRLLVEGAGGLLAPLSDTETMADLAAALGYPLLVVVRFYVGSINHTLLTLEAARARSLPIAALACAGGVNPASLAAIQTRYKLALVAV